jgi:predicted  nucleic acid-binding Zn-ribbon protein
MDTAARGDREAENPSAEAAAEQPTAPTLAELEALADDIEQANMEVDYAVWKKKREQLKHALARKERERAALLQGYYDPQRRQADLNQLSSHLLGLCDELRDEARYQSKTALRRHAQQVTDTMFAVFQELAIVAAVPACQTQRSRKRRRAPQLFSWIKPICPPYTPLLYTSLVPKRRGHRHSRLLMSSSASNRSWSLG